MFLKEHQERKEVKCSAGGLEREIEFTGKIGDFREAQVTRFILKA